MKLEYQIAAAFLLDLLLGDPRWFPHPVRGIGWLAIQLETPLRKRIPNARLAGLLAVIIVLAATGMATFLLIQIAAKAHPFLGNLVSVFILYTAFAARDLSHHGWGVYRALRKNDLAQARERVSLLVGRDTASLDETGVVRAAVESVAENLVDGVTAPIFFAALGGPIGAMLYKAINTLDSTFGYKDERYLYFGWASARLDDLANYLPSRLTAPLVALAALPLGLDAKNSLCIALRDGSKHQSPNAGLAEAAVAGALGVQLGGMDYYGGSPCEHSKIGDPVHLLKREHIQGTTQLMFATSTLALLAFVGARLGFFKLFHFR